MIWQERESAYWPTVVPTVDLFACPAREPPLQPPAMPLVCVRPRHIVSIDPREPPGWLRDSLKRSSRRSKPVRFPCGCWCLTNGWRRG